MGIRSVAAAAKIGFMILLAQGVAAQAAQVKVLSAVAMRSVMNELGPQFERATGHKLVIKFEVIGVLKRQVDAGEAFDVAILTSNTIDDLVKAGKIAAGTRADIARSGIGVVVRAGVPKPDISSADAFKRAMLNAKSITYAKDTPPAIHIASLVERLGIAEQMKPKIKLLEGAGGTGRIVHAVAAGEADLGFAVISAIDLVPGAELLGPLPPELQNDIVYTGGVGAAAKEADAGKALIKFLMVPAAVAVIKSKGMEPGTP